MELGFCSAYTYIVHVMPCAIQTSNTDRDHCQWQVPPGISCRSVAWLTCWLADSLHNSAFPTQMLPPARYRLALSSTFTAQPGTIQIQVIWASILVACAIWQHVRLTVWGLEQIYMAGHRQVYLFISKRMPSRWHSPWVCCDCSEVAPQQHEDLCKFRLELELESKCRKEQ